MHTVPLVDAEQIWFKSFTWISSLNPRNSLIIVLTVKVLSLAPIFTEEEQKHLGLNRLNNTASK